MSVRSLHDRRERRLRRALRRLALAAGLLAVHGVAAANASDDVVRQGDQRELAGSQPGAPVRATPGASAVEPVRFLSYVHRQVNVDATGANIVGDAANEPSIAVDPTHPNHLAIGWRQFASVSNNFREAGYAYSRDGGITWTFPGVLEEGVFRSDPVLDSDADGNFYYLGLTMTRPPEAITRTCHLFKSTDGGMTWGPAVFAYGGDKEWMAIDRSNGPGRGNIYSSWNPIFSDYGADFFVRSVDGGATFEAPIPLPTVPLFGTMVVGDDGTLHVAGKKGGSGSDEYVYLRSTNAQDPAATPTFTSTTFAMGGLVATGAAYPFSPNPDGYLGQVWIDLDRSGGPRDGNIYALCSVDPPDSPLLPADPMDIHFVRSEDGGATWSAPVRVNDDAVGTGAWQWFGTMSVAPNGRIDAVWNDTRNTLTASYSELFYSYSTDGGVTWAANQQCSPLWNSYMGFPTQNKIGDYYDTVSDRVGVHVAWAATFTAGQDIYYLRIGDYDCNDNGIGDPRDIEEGASADSNLNGIPDECEDFVVAVFEEPSAMQVGARLRCAPNPFNPETTISFELLEAGAARLAVFDLAGRLVRTLVDESMAAGGHEVVWDGRDASGREVGSGTYQARLSFGGRVEVVRMVMVR